MCLPSCSLASVSIFFSHDQQGHYLRPFLQLEKLFIAFRFIIAVLPSARDEALSDFLGTKFQLDDVGSQKYSYCTVMRMHENFEVLLWLYRSPPCTQKQLLCVVKAIGSYICSHSVAKLPPFQLAR